MRKSPSIKSLIHAMLRRRGDMAFADIRLNLEMTACATGMALGRMVIAGEAIRPERGVYRLAGTVE